MASPASIARHPIHAMLVPFPIGLWVFSLIADAIVLAGWGGPVWNDVALYTMAGGLIGGLLAAAPGLIDFLSLQDPTARRIGAAHLALNLLVVALFAVNFWLRTTGRYGLRLPVTLSVIAVLLLVASGWLGGAMVYAHGVGVAASDARKDL
jgi:uncharacterized membrane protein